MSLIIKSQSQKYTLQPTQVDFVVDIVGKMANCQLTQKFVFEEKIEITDAEYIFPVDYNAAFYDLTIVTPRETIKGVVKEKEEAKIMYMHAISKGKEAYLVEEMESDRDLYRLSIGKILSDDIIEIKYNYVTESNDNDIYHTFYVPQSVSGRYRGPIINQDSNYKLNISINIKDFIEFVRPLNSNFVTGTFEDVVSCGFESDKSLEEDIEIAYKIKMENKAYKFNINNYTMVMANFIPFFESSEENSKIMFVLDCSGSMKGDRIKYAKEALIECIQHLPTDYKFNIVCFGNDVYFYSNVWVSAHQENIKKVIEHIKTIDATLGGTEIKLALESVLNVGAKDVILITDGDTSNNQQLHSVCKKFNKLNILGIGTAINRANIQDMAKNGHGVAIFCNKSELIVESITRLFKYLKTSIIASPQYSLQTVGSWFTNNSIVSGRYNTVYAILANETSDIFNVEGLTLDLKLENLNNYNGFEYLIAKKIVQENNKIDKKSLIKLATEFNIITQYTSLVAISSLGYGIPNKIKKKKTDGPQISCLSMASSKSCGFIGSISMKSHTSKATPIPRKQTTIDVFEPVFNTINSIDEMQVVDPIFNMNENVSLRSQISKQPLDQSQNVPNISIINTMTSVFKPIIDTTKKSLNDIQVISLRPQIINKILNQKQNMDKLVNDLAENQFYKDIMFYPDSKLSTPYIIPQHIDLCKQILDLYCELGEKPCKEVLDILKLPVWLANHDRLYMELYILSYIALYGSKTQFSQFYSLVNKNVKDIYRCFWDIKYEDCKNSVPSENILKGIEKYLNNP